jgi:hypothetical protein
MDADCCPSTGLSRQRCFRHLGLAGLGGREPVAEGDGECVDGGPPPHGPPGLALAGGVEGSGDQVEAFERRLLGGEMAAGLDRPPVPGVQRLDGVGGADDLADLQVVVQERDELVPGVVPQPDDRRVPPAPGLGEVVERGPGGGGADGGVDGFDAAFEGVPVAARGEPEGCGSGEAVNIQSGVSGLADTLSCPATAASTAAALE